jgi:hypothetical protein
MEAQMPNTDTTDTARPGLTAHLIGRRVVVRCYASGVHYGTLTAHEGRQVILTDSRRLWRWHTGGKDKGVSLSAVALTGIDATRSTVEPALGEITLLDALEIIPATDAAATSIEAA